MNGIIDKINNKNKLLRFLLVVVGVLLTAFAFNLFLLPNNIVNGFSGLAVIFKHLFNWRPSIFIGISYVVILILSFIFLGKDNTRNSIIGSILYPLFVELTSFIVPYIDINSIEPILIVICGALLGGLGLGIVHKAGYSTGGSSTLSQLVTKFIKRPLGTSTMIINVIIIVAGFFIFGFRTVIYSIITAFITSFIIDRVMIGISNSKSFYVITEYEDAVKDFLLSQLSHGVTIIEARGGYTNRRVKMILCIVPNKEYYIVKEGILEIDEKSLILVNDTYEVLGTK